MDSKKETIEKLRSYIREYDNVFVLGDGIWAGEKFFGLISCQDTKRVLLLVTELKTSMMQKCSIEIRKISFEEYSNIEELYYMYEFSDRIHLLVDNDQYGSLRNYISGGLMTEEETVAALLL